MEYLVLSDREILYMGSSLSSAKYFAKKSWNKQIYIIKKLK